MPRIDPLEWLSVANLRRPRYEGLTEWHPGTVAPAHVGWYERHFTDSTICEPSSSMHYWDGLRWLTEQGKPHWRQVGDYPAWRGSTRNLRVGQQHPCCPESSDTGLRLPGPPRVLLSRSKKMPFRQSLLHAPWRCA